MKNELTFPDSFVAFWIEVVWLFDVVYRLCLSVDVATVKTVLCSWNGKTPIKYRHFCGQQNRSNKKYSLKTVIDCLFKDVMTYFWPVGLEEGGGGKPFAKSLGKKNSINRNCVVPSPPLSPPLHQLESLGRPWNIALIANLLDRFLPFP